MPWPLRRKDTYHLPGARHWWVRLVYARCGVVFLHVSMLGLLIAFFALFAGLVRFAEHVIRRRDETGSLPAGAVSEPPDQGAVVWPPGSQPG